MKHANKTNITIVKYEPTHAKAVAKMWNESSEGWGGHSEVKTEEEVRIQEENSTNIITYIAFDGDEAVGYCGLSEYREDVGSLYVPLLNVRTDYHGKKIGKQLLLKALEETIDRGWPRLDLNTWPGNTKAVPLYKKCGFFWENRDDSVHLMNFLPTVLNIPAFTSFFNKTNWYEHSVRAIEVEPDGRKEGDFELYDYFWKHEGDSLHVAIEKTGRGICEVKTNEYAISMHLDSHKVIYGKGYPVRFRINNYTRKPLHIKLAGINQDNIEFPMFVQSEVSNSDVLEGSFILSETNKLQSSKKTHPTITANVWINDQELILKTGILPIAPVKCIGKTTGTFSILNREQLAYIELENNCNSDVTLFFRLNNHEGVTFGQERWQVDLTAHQRTTIPIPYTLSRATFYNENIAMTMVDNNNNISFSQQLTFPFHSPGFPLHGECLEYYHLFHGFTHISIKKETNELLYERGQKNSSEYTFHYPKLGKPFSEEFSIASPIDVKFYVKAHCVGVVLTYESRDFPHVFLHREVELTGDGIMSQQYVIENKGDKALKNLQLNYAHSFSLEDAHIPYDGQIVYIPGTLHSEVIYWEDKKLTENWLLSHAGNKHSALIWEEHVPIHFQHWHHQYFEECFPEIDSGKRVKSQKMWFGQQIFSSVDEVREFANQKSKIITTNEEPLSFSIKGSPIIKNEAIVTFQPFVKKNVDLDLTILSNEGNFAHSITRSKSEPLSAFNVHIPVKSENVMSVQLKGTLSSQHVDKQLVLFQETTTSVKTEEKVVDGHHTYEISNDIFTLKSAPSFFPSFYSLTDSETEWLASSFPTPISKSWWNPWVGGLSFGIEYLLQRKMLDLPSKAKFVTVFDQYSEEWTGIQITTIVEDHPKYEGLTFHQFAVTRPGIPVLAFFTLLEQNVGKHFYGTIERTYFNLSQGEKIGDLTIHVNDQESQAFQHHAHEVDLYHLKDALFERKGIKNKLHFIPNKSIEDVATYMNKEVILGAAEQPLYTKNGETEITEPHFFVLSEHTYKLGDYHSLRSLRFTIERKSSSENN
ncbi:GNAT family N-acetyltransferase [Evansella cellulosilytica]|uniref:GCN5-related N-acetyltransferase n=1 Tax=Evansella cellulosilytica (strain ATCC 21833 / DSM 2522 / FERM P-1141 / JCM 9156 / N-4) TaxID=649639 RepID=E6U250_EVAC2|nr:GNAT family N-acetyltransferase [Evansella cellulosilytica]ADU30428.1 GCN5-related N-acetyltransferase [Evansella cellulosilytica DSM 2522]